MPGIVSTPMAASTSPTWPPDSAPGGPPSSGVRVLFGSEALAWLGANALENGRYWRGVLTLGPDILAPNLAVRAGLVVRGNEAWPLTVDDAGRDNSYPCSLHCQYVSYPREELGLIPSAGQRLLARLGLAGLAGILRAAQADRMVQWNSWLLSTNPLTPGLTDAVVPVTVALSQAFPRHAVLLKNVHAWGDPGLPARLAQAGYRLVTSRQVYLFEGNPPDFLDRSTTRRDWKQFVTGAHYRLVEHDQFVGTDLSRIRQLYSRVYLEKHTPLNPQYTLRFVERAWADRWMEFRGLRDPGGRLDAVYASFTAGRTVTVPFIGYDTGLPMELGLYRHLVVLLLQRVAEERALLNYSSGAGEFKRRRGGQPVIEYNAIYARHLSPARQAALGLLATLANRVGRPFLERNGI